MTGLWPGGRVAVLLGLGAADLCALNVWVMPGLLVPAGDEVQSATMAATESSWGNASCWSSKALIDS